MKLLHVFVLVLGDQIIELNGNSLQDVTHHEAITKFKAVKKGVVNLVVRSKLFSPGSRLVCQIIWWSISMQKL